MQSLGGDVSAVRPDNGSKLLVQLNPREVLRVSKRSKDSSPLFIREIDLTRDAVVEIQAKSMPAKTLNLGDVNDPLHGADAREEG